MALDFSIRPARHEDAKALAEIYRSSAAHHVAIDPDRYRVPDQAPVVEHFRKILSGTEGIVLVADLDGVVMGVVQARPLPEPSAHSMIRPAAKATIDLAVLDRYRRQGVGTALLTAATEWADGAGLTALVLDASVANLAAIALYERHGYRAFGTLMERPLT